MIEFNFLPFYFLVKVDTLDICYLETIPRTLLQNRIFGRSQEALVANESRKTGNKTGRRLVIRGNTMDYLVECGNGIVSCLANKLVPTGLTSNLTKV